MKRIYFFLILITLVALGGCGKSKSERKAEQAEAAERERQAFAAAFRVAVTPTLDCLPVFLMIDSCVVDTSKLDVRMLMFTSHIDVDTAFINGRVHLAFSDLVRMERIHKRKIAVGYLAPTAARWELIGNKSDRINRLSQLGDRMLAMTRFSATDLLADMAIKEAKAENKIYKVQINDINIRCQMLANNEMNALFLPEPQATAAREKGNKVLFSSVDKDVRLGVIAIKDAEIYNDERNRQLDEFSKAYDKACDLINKRGLKYYSALIIKYCGVDERTVAALPKITFPKCGKLREKDQKTALSF